MKVIDGDDLYPAKEDPKGMAVAREALMAAPGWAHAIDDLDVSVDPEPLVREKRNRKNPAISTFTSQLLSDLTYEMAARHGLTRSGWVRLVIAKAVSEATGESMESLLEGGPMTYRFPDWSPERFRTYHGGGLSGLHAGVRDTVTDLDG